MKLNIKALTPEWHDKRRGSITATDVPAILGLSSYKSALDVWARITGKIDAKVLEDNPYLNWGNVSENLNAEMFAKDSGRVVSMCGELWQDDTRPYLLATPDAFQCTPDVARRVLEMGEDTPLQWNDGDLAIAALINEGSSDSVGMLELKAPSIWKASDWKDGIPIAFQLQTTVQMIVCGVKWGSCSALCPPEVQWADVEPSPRVVDSVITSIEKFWAENILRDEPPTVIDRNPDVTLAALKLLHPLDNGVQVELSPGASEAARSLSQIKLEIKGLEKREKELKAAIQREMGDNTFGVIPGTVEGFSWKHQERNMKATEARTLEMRVFRAAKIKGTK